MAKIKTQAQIQKRIKDYCKAVNEMQKELSESTDNDERNYLHTSINLFLANLLQLGWVSGINYDKLIK